MSLDSSIGCGVMIEFFGSLSIEFSAIIFKASASMTDFLFVCVRYCITSLTNPLTSIPVERPGPIDITLYESM